MIADSVNISINFTLIILPTDYTDSHGHSDETNEKGPWRAIPHAESYVR